VSERPGRLLVALIGLLVLLAGCSTAGPGATPTPTPTVAPVVTPDVDIAVDVSVPEDWSGGTVRLEELPPEAHETLALVAAGGPYPYRQDDGIFFNREGLLPARPSGTYREYTVETPGSPDRGARRLVIGEGRDVYWTDDHYASFRYVLR
jgi:ribonuclease T1